MDVNSDDKNLGSKVKRAQVWNSRRQGLRKRMCRSWGLTIITSTLPSCSPELAFDFTATLRAIHDTKSIDRIHVGGRSIGTRGRKVLRRRYGTLNVYNSIGNISSRVGARNYTWRPASIFYVDLGAKLSEYASLTRHRKESNGGIIGARRWR